MRVVIRYLSEVLFHRIHDGDFLKPLIDSFCKNEWDKG